MSPTDRSDRHPDVVADTVAQSLRDDPSSLAVTEAIHDSTHPGEIAAQVTSSLAAVSRSAPVAGCLFHQASVGTATGVRMADGECLVVKAYQPAWDREFLDGVLDTQRRLRSAGVPCGEPVGEPIRCGHGYATVETYVPDPGQPAQFGNQEMSASAAGLALIIDNAGADHRLDAHPLRPRSSHGLYPEPHSPAFNFEATTTGAEWIDDLARLARANKTDTPTVVAHTDWSARNVRLRADGIAAVYDMDSLAVISLPAAVGQAAATWRATGEAGEPVAPDLDEIEDWFDCFPIRLSKAERSASIAAALWTLAYTARCEHAIDPNERTHRRARPRLRQDAARYRRALN